MTENEAFPGLRAAGLVVQVGIAYASATLPSIEDSPNSRVNEWLRKVADLTMQHVAKQKATCCYCGPDAGGAENGCSLACVCAWEHAHNLWLDRKESQTALSMQDQLYLERAFDEAYNVRPRLGSSSCILGRWCSRW